MYALKVDNLVFEHNEKNKLIRVWILQKPLFVDLKRDAIQEIVNYLTAVLVRGV